VGGVIVSRSHRQEEGAEDKFQRLREIREQGPAEEIRLVGGAVADTAHTAAHH
jgi:hypothetical protein